jgi:acetyl-CoA acetyltransferase
MTGVLTDYLTPPDRELSRRAAIVGVGNTDYGDDYRASRSNDPDYVRPTSVSLARTAFERALADARLDREDVDGLGLCLLYGSEDVQTMIDVLGIEPRLARIEPIPLVYDAIPSAVQALVSYECDTIALLYSAPSRAIGRRYGGSAHADGGQIPLTYHYYHPWGWSSQAAHWALIFQHYQNAFGATEEDLAHVAITVRQHAIRNSNAIMRTPLTVDDYLDARYIVRPLRLFDLCLVNDGGVCIILQRTDMAKDRAHDPVEIAGWAHAKSAHPSEKFRHLVQEHMRPQFEAAGDLAFAMANLERSDVGHFQGYDASSIHLISQLEGYGLVPAGGGLEFAKRGGMDLDGRVPVNTSGGMLSEAYMHGWNHIAEAVRQLRHEAGDRQVPDLQVSLFSMADTDSTHPLLLVRGAS